MKAVFNLGLDNEVTLYFNQITENYQVANNTNPNPLTLELRKFDLDVNNTMVSYCAPILAENFIQTIHCYEENDSLSIVFNKYTTVFSVRTVLNDSGEEEQGKIGYLTLIQK